MKALKIILAVLGVGATGAILYMVALLDIYTLYSILIVTGLLLICLFTAFLVKIIKEKRKTDIKSGDKKVE